MFDTRTPVVISNEILDLCTAIDPAQQPQYVQVIAEPGYVFDECFFNVRDKIEKHGGAIQFGWAIWEWISILIEAEFHAVWISPEGELVDVSEKPNNIERILFLPDTQLEYDYSIEGFRVNNIRKPIVDHSIIHELIDLMEQRFLLEEKYSKGRIVEIPKDEFLPIERRVGEIALMIQQGKHFGKIGRNAPCPCGSGKKYKKCCIKN
jgi:hypothetical protein